MKLPWEMTKSQFRIFLACLMCAFTATFTMIMVASTISELSKSYDISYFDSIWIAESATISALVFSLLSADLCDKYGKRTMIIIGMVMIMASSLIAMFSDNIYLFFFSRSVSGIGAAMVFSANVSMITDLSKKEYNPELLSFNHVATSLGGALGPLFGYFITDAFGLDALFLMTVPFCLLAIVLVRCADNIRVNPSKAINYPLHFMIIGAIFCLLTGIIMVGTTSFVFLGIGALLLVLSVIFSKRSNNKILDLSILKNHTFVLAVIVGLIFSVCAYSVDNSMTYYLQLNSLEISLFGIMIVSSAALAAFTKGMKPIVQIIASPTLARLGRGKDPTRLSSIGFILLMVTYILGIILAFIDLSGWVIVICVAISMLVALGNSIFKPMNKSVMMTSVPDDKRNVASSFVSIVDNFGKLAGVLIIVNVLYYAGGTSTHDLDICLQIMVGTVITLTAIGLFLCIRRNRKKCTE